MNLYELAKNYRTLIEIDDETLKDTLESIEEAFEVKAENIIKLIRNTEIEAEGFKQEADRLLGLAAIRKNKSKWLKEYLLSGMDITGKTKINTSIGTISKAKNPPSVNICNEKLVPEQFFKVIPEKKEIDKKSILEAIKAGEEVKGAELHQGFRIAVR